MTSYISEGLHFRGGSRELLTLLAIRVLINSKRIFHSGEWNGSFLYDISTGSVIMQQFNVHGQYSLS